jgi:hypothetical protein
MILFIMDDADGPAKGFVEVISSKSTTPRAHISLSKEGL